MLFSVDYGFKKISAIRLMFCLFKSKIENKRLLPKNIASKDFLEKS
jgi:hypothetical protein